jgi:DNA-binding transcriptional LysR family regulator
MDRLQAMTAFVAVADLQGFAPAAKRLELSPSAVTRLVASLEEHLGARLLQRTTRAVTLTDAGQRYLERVRRILADLEEADGDAQAERAAPIGRIVVAAPALFGRLHVAPVLSEFLQRHPAVSGELRLSDRIENLVEEGVDVTVRIGALEDSGLVARLVGSTRRVVVASPAYLDRRAPPLTPEDVASHDVIQFTGVAHTPAWRFLRAGEERRVPFAPRLVTNCADAAIGHAERGGGLTMALAYQVTDAVRAGRLRVVLADCEPPPLPIQVVFPSARLLPAKVRAFLDLVTKRGDWRFIDL